MTVVGAGLSGLTAAFDLARKGYAVTVVEASDRAGGSLWEFPENTLPRQILRDELAIVGTVGAEIHLNATLPDDGLTTLRGGCDAIYLATGQRSDATLRPRSGQAFGLALDALGRIAVDPITFATSLDGVFAGGEMLRPPAERSPVRAISDGRGAPRSPSTAICKGCR